MTIHKCDRCGKDVGDHNNLKSTWVGEDKVFTEFCVHCNNDYVAWKQSIEKFIKEKFDESFTLFMEMGHE